MTVKLTELGVPLLEWMDRDTPALARMFVESRYRLSEKKRKQMRELVEEVAVQMRLNDRFSFALPSSSKEIIRLEARQSRMAMSKVACRHIIHRES